MAFWSDNFAEQGNTLRDPKRKFRFLVRITGISGTDIWYAKTAAKPSFTIASAEHKYLNHTFYYPGAVTWNDVAITLVDPGDPDSAATLAEIVEKGGYHPPANSSDLSTMTKSSAAQALGQVTVTALNGAGNSIEEWTLNNAFITDLKFGDLEYGGDDLTELSMTLKYDWATLNDSAPADSAGAAGSGNKGPFFGTSVTGD
jgi:hypothetical protein|tara:strand:- start:3147 stop:3749 length:603 start_codon:yes stop_codon:yes gene_type:complete